MKIFLKLVMENRVSRKFEWSVCMEIARLQDFAPNTQGLLGALSGPQTPCRIERTPFLKFLPTGLPFMKMGHLQKKYSQKWNKKIDWLGACHFTWKILIFFTNFSIKKCPPSPCNFFFSLTHQWRYVICIPVVTFCVLKICIIIKIFECQVETR